MVSPFLFLTFGKRIHFFTDLVLRMFLVSLSSSKIFWIFPCLFIRLFSLMHFLDLLADFSNSLFFVLRRRLPFLYEGQNLFVFTFHLLCFRCFQMLLLLPQCSLWWFVHLLLPSVLPLLPSQRIGQLLPSLLLLLMLFSLGSFVPSPVLTSCSRSLFISSCSSPQVFFNFDWWRLAATCWLFCFLGSRTSPWHICGHFTCQLYRWPPRLCSSRSVFSQSKCSPTVSRHISERGTLLVFAISSCTLCSARQDSSHVTIVSSIRLCSSLCRVCSEQHLIIQYQLQDQAQRWNLLQWSSCLFFVDYLADRFVCSLDMVVRVSTVW